MQQLPNPAPVTARIVRRGPRVASPSEVPAISVLPVPSAVLGHEPWHKDRVATLSDRGVLTRAATLLGMSAEQLPLPLRWHPLPGQLAVLRTTAEVLPARLEETTGACPECAATERRLDCARELGTLEARLAALAYDAKPVLGWLEESPSAG